MPVRIVGSGGDRTRRAILRASYRLFVRQGYAATSMRQVAAHARVALGGIYNHFSSKEDIFRAIIEERHPLLHIMPLLLAAPGANAADFVHNAANTFVQQLGRHPDILNLMLIEIVEFKARHVPQLFEQFYPMLAALAARINVTHSRARHVPEFVMARAFLGMFFSYYFTEILLGKAMPAGTGAKAIDHFVEIFLHGVLEEQRS
jgi:AcrR family transcriptional regulator